jgi:hypothetical protein
MKAKTVSLAKVTKEMWVDGLLLAWKECGQMYHAIKAAYGFPMDVSLESTTFMTMAKGISEVCPRVIQNREGEYFLLKADVILFIRNLSKPANDALWSGRINLGRSILLKVIDKDWPPKSETPIKRAHRAPIPNIDIRYIPMCGGFMSDKTDWKKVK